VDDGTGRESGAVGGGPDDFDLMMMGSRTAVTGLGGLAALAGALDVAAARVAVRTLDLRGFAALARAAADFALRGADFAVFRAAGALRAAALVAGFLILEVFLPGIKFSAARLIERRIIAPVRVRSSAVYAPDRRAPNQGSTALGLADQPGLRCSAMMLV
jgi:hypothetical protein